MAGRSDGLEKAIALAFDRASAEGGGPPVTLDPHRRIRRLPHSGRSLVAKRCTAEAASRERDLAAAARDRSPSTSPPIVVVVPDVVTLANGHCALVTVDLGEPLSMNPAQAAHLMPRFALLSILTALLAAGIEAPGFVPRNLFWNGATLLAIDWEDARVGASPAVPDDLTIVKWDIAWSDVLREDPRLRHYFTASAAPRPLDRFERALAELAGRPMEDAEVRRIGLRLTLASERYVPTAAPLSAAELGHLADEVLDSRYSVLHTVLTAYVRENAGVAAYASMVERLWSAVRPAVAGDEKPVTSCWLTALCTSADRALAPPGPALDTVADDLHRLVGRTGWTVGCERARLAELLLARVAGMITQAFDAADLQLLLRGSLSQGVLGRRSDVDFELSSPEWPNGHRALEELVIDVLAAFGLDAEGSAARPSETDVHGPGTNLTRDAHEWLELRRPGSPLHDPGWLGVVLTPDVAKLVGRPSQYERRGREETAKYLWFEARAALARVVFSSSASHPPATLVDQLARLPSLVAASDAADLTETVKASFALRERTSSFAAERIALGRLLDATRRSLRLAGSVDGGPAAARSDD